MGRRLKTILIAAVVALCVGLVVIAMTILSKGSSTDAFGSTIEKIGPKEAAYADGTMTVSEVENVAEAATESPADETAESQKEAEELFEKIQNETITLQLADSISDTISADTISSWTSLDGTTVSVDEGKVADYVASLASQYDTWGKQISVTTHSGQKISLGAVNYGWKLSKDTTASDLRTAILAGEGGTVKATWASREAVMGTDGVGGTYIEADLDEQHLYVYKDGAVVISSDLVSGRAIENWSTPNGVFEIVGMQKDATLKGEDYETPVSYWMPFYLGWGFHDASWRSSFGKDIYVSNGSHGCCNLPPAVAGELFRIAYPGMPVIVHGGMSKSQAVTYLASKKAESDEPKPEGAAEADSQSAEAAAAAQAAAENSAAVAAVQQAAAASGFAVDEQQSAIISQAVANYMAVGMTSDQAAAQVFADLQAQATAVQQAAAAQAAAPAQPAASDPAAAQPASPDPAAAQPAPAQPAAPDPAAAQPPATDSAAAAPQA